MLHNMRFLRTFNVIVFLSLSFFEQPIWCSNTGNTWYVFTVECVQVPTEVHQANALSYSLLLSSFSLLLSASHPLFSPPPLSSPPDPATVLTFGLPVLSSTVTLTVELICVVLFFMEMAAKATILGKSQFLRNRWYMIQIVLLTADLTGVGVKILAPDSLPLWNPIIRPIVFVAMSQSMRGESPSCSRCFILRTR